ncbi:MAG: DUF4198 domain-containing protein [Pseudomonas sp.]|nr:DUF4198 domain-containing protein [Pseudomonas sp.]
MKTKYGFSLALLLGAISISSAHAHGVWIEERHDKLEAVYGDGPLVDSYDPKKLVQASQWNGSEKSKADIHALEKYAVISADNADMVSVVLDNGYWTKNTSGKWINDKKSNVENPEKGQHSIKYGVYINDSKASLSGLESEMPLAITSEVNPLLVGVGKEMVLNVWLDGKPAVDVVVYADYKNMHSEILNTDKEGKVKIVVRNEGLNVIAAQANKPLVDNADADSVSMVSTLSFVAVDMKH